MGHLVENVVFQVSISPQYFHMMAGYRLHNIPKIHRRLGMIGDEVCKKLKITACFILLCTKLGTFLYKNYTNHHISFIIEVIAYRIYFSIKYSIGKQIRAEVECVSCLKLKL